MIVLKHSRPVALGIAVLSALLLLPQRPAHAQAAINAITTAIRLYKQLSQNGLTLQQATDQIIAAIEAAEADIHAHISATQVADQRVCVENAISALANLSTNWGLVTLDTVQADARAAQDCVNGIVDTIGSMAASPADTPFVDELGFALGTIAPILGVLNKAAGWATTPDTFGTIHQGFLTDSSVLMASTHCSQQTNWSDCAAPCRNPEVLITCTAYDGNQGGVDTFLNDPNIPQEKQQARVDSLGATSYQLAQLWLSLFG